MPKFHQMIVISNFNTRSIRIRDNKWTGWLTSENDSKNVKSSWYLASSTGERGWGVDASRQPSMAQGDLASFKLYITISYINFLMSQPTVWARCCASSKLYAAMGFLVNSIEMFRAELSQDNLAQPFFGKMANFESNGIPCSFQCLSPRYILHKYDAAEGNIY